MRRKQPNETLVLIFTSNGSAKMTQQTVITYWKSKGRLAKSEREQLPLCAWRLCWTRLYNSLSILFHHCWLVYMLWWKSWNARYQWINYFYYDIGSWLTYFWQSLFTNVILDCMLSAMSLKKTAKHCCFCRWNCFSHCYKITILCYYAIESRSDGSGP